MEEDDRTMKATIKLPEPIAVKCHNFLTEVGKRTVTVIIVPLKVVEAENGSYLISWACSRGEFCQDINCIYSKARKGRR